MISCVFFFNSSIFSSFGFIIFFAALNVSTKGVLAALVKAVTPCLPLILAVSVIELKPVASLRRRLSSSSNSFSFSNLFFSSAFLSNAIRIFCASSLELPDLTSIPNCKAIAFNSSILGGSPPNLSGG